MSQVRRIFTFASLIQYIVNYGAQHQKCSTKLAMLPQKQKIFFSLKDLELFRDVDFVVSVSVAFISLRCLEDGGITGKDKSGQKLSKKKSMR